MSISKSDSFRAIEDACSPDPRQASFSILDLRKSETRPRTLEDLHLRIAELHLHEGVPEEIRIHFETARNLYLYSWFVYRFIPVAELHALSSLEFALKERAHTDTSPVKQRGLCGLLKEAYKRGWIKDEGLRISQRFEMARKQREEDRAALPEELRTSLTGPEEKKVDSYLKSLIFGLSPSGRPDAKPVYPLSDLRNILAHGTSALTSSADYILEICCDLINQLFEPLSDQQVEG